MFVKNDFARKYNEGFQTVLLKQIRALLFQCPYDN